VGDKLIKNNSFSRRKFLNTANYGLMGLTFSSMTIYAFAQTGSNINNEGISFPPPENEGGWLNTQ
jgi:hypothetical protein